MLYNVKRVSTGLSVLDFAQVGYCDIKNMDVTIYDSITKYAGAFYNDKGALITGNTSVQKPYEKGAGKNQDDVHDLLESKQRIATQHTPDDTPPEDSKKVFVLDKHEKVTSAASPKNNKGDNSPKNEVLITEHSIESPDGHHAPKESDNSKMGIKLRAASPEITEEPQRRSDRRNSKTIPSMNKSKQSHENLKMSTSNEKNNLGRKSAEDIYHPKHNSFPIEEVQEMYSPEKNANTNVGIVEDFKPTEDNNVPNHQDQTINANMHHPVRKRNSRILSRPAVHFHETNEQENKGPEQPVAHHPRLVIKRGSVNNGTNLQQVKKPQEPILSEMPGYNSNQTKPNDEIRKSMLDPLPKLDQMDINEVESPNHAENPKQQYGATASGSFSLGQKDTSENQGWKPINANLGLKPQQMKQTSQKDIDTKKTQEELEWEVQNKNQKLKIISRKMQNNGEKDMIEKLNKDDDTDSVEDEWQLDIKTPAKKGKGVASESQNEIHSKVTLPAKPTGIISYKPGVVKNEVSAQQTTGHVTLKLGVNKKKAAPKDDSDNSWD